MAVAEAACLSVSVVCQSASLQSFKTQMRVETRSRGQSVSSKQVKFKKIPFDETDGRTDDEKGHEKTA